MLSLEKKMKDYCVELKVCEGCGALFLRSANHGARVPRTAGDDRGLRTAPATTCRGCALRLAEFPAPRERRRRGFELRAGRRCAGHGTGTAASAGGAR
jgi:hypothetical protein